MVKRTVRRSVRNIIFAVVSLIIAVFIGILIFASVRSALPLLSEINSSNSLIKPVTTDAGFEKIKKQLDAKDIILESIKVSSTSPTLIIAQLKDGPLVYFSSDEDANWQVTSLQLILQHLTIDNKKPVMVDLRQARPIVKFGGL